MHTSDPDEKFLADLLRQRSRAALEGSTAAARRLQEIDRRIHRRFERTVATFVLDMAGFTRLTVLHGIVHYLMLIRRMQDVCVPVIRRLRGRLVKTEADNLFAWFPSVDRAVAASLQMFDRLSEINMQTDDESDVQVSIGIGWGPTLVMGHDMWGSEFNFASKLGEDLAGAGEVLLTTAAHHELRGNPYRFRRRPVVVSGMPYDAWLLRLTARGRR
ncbi:MAG: adenylate/guanylate cyclase domain-containing protein [Deltaproteobacteria bacterium]|nr:adenylate/guanylate cyclase domain-containing protein [Deltaproteobacteria bacterium]